MSSRNTKLRASSASIQPELEVPTFKPTKEEFMDFDGYVAGLEKICKNIGLCKVNF